MLCKYYEPIKIIIFILYYFIFSKLEPHEWGKSSGLGKNHTNQKYKIQKGHVMVFASKYFNSKHKHISHLNILTMSLFDWPIIRRSYQKK